MPDQYNSAYTGAQIDGAVNKALNADPAPVSGSTNLVQSGGVAGKSLLVSVTIAAASWAAGLYTISNANITALCAVEILPGLAITAAQLTALQNANIQENSQSAGSIVIKAFGTVPAVDIPIRMIIRKDLY